MILIEAELKSVCMSYNYYPFDALINKVTDDKTMLSGLSGLKNKKTTQNRSMCRVNRLQFFDYEIEHIQGKLRDERVAAKTNYSDTRVPVACLYVNHENL